MRIEDLQSYIIPLLIIAFFGWRFLKFKMVKRQLPELLKKGAVIVDVRSPQEFVAGATPGSINIPLNELGQRLKELDPAKPVIVCCASGTRSGMALHLLKNNGFQSVVNAGPWGNTL